MEKFIEFDGIFNVAVGVGGIAVLLGIWSLWLRYREVRAPWARRLCLVSDILNTTFVSITVVGVLTVSFSLVIHLPALARSTEISDLEGKIERLDRLVYELDEGIHLHSAILRLREADELDLNSLERAVESVLGDATDYHGILLSGDFPAGDGYWFCRKEAGDLDDDPLLCGFAERIIVPGGLRPID